MIPPLYRPGQIVYWVNSGEIVCGTVEFSRTTSAGTTYTLAGWGNPIAENDLYCLWTTAYCRLAGI